MHLPNPTLKLKGRKLRKTSYAILSPNKLRHEKVLDDLACGCP